VIILYAGMMLRKPDLTPKDRERLVTISQQAKQATNLTGQILDFSRTSVIERRALDLVPLSGGKPLELEVGTPVHGHGETILVVEDEPAARDAVAEALQSLGYQVLVAANGREALSVFEQHGDKIALVLSDLMMPGISGTELFRILKQKKPAVKIVAMTGYPLQFKARDLPVQDWLQKPLSAEQLAEAVQRALET